MVESGFSFPGCSRLQVTSLKTPQPTCSHEDQQVLSKSKNDTSNWFSCNFPVTFNHNCPTPNSPIVFISTYYMCVCVENATFTGTMMFQPLLELPTWQTTPVLWFPVTLVWLTLTSPSSSASAYSRLVGCHVALYCMPNTVHSLSGS